jgi:hypothetical protein
VMTVSPLVVAWPSAGATPLSPALTPSRRKPGQAIRPSANQNQV